MTSPTQAPPEPGLTPAKVAALIALIETQAQVREQLTAASVAAAVAAFSSIKDWWDTREVQKAITSALRVIQPNQRQAARVTDAFVARAMQVMTGRSYKAAGAVDITKLRREMPPAVAEKIVAGKLDPVVLFLGEHDPDHGRVIAGPEIDKPVTMVIPDALAPAAQRLEALRSSGAQAVVVPAGEPYGRVADAYRYQVVARGIPEEKARKTALVRIAAVAETDVTLAVREQYRKNMTTLTGITGWRRIVRPDRSTTGPCGLCVVAADRRYSKEDLEPIHNGCVCEVLPIIGKLDPGLSLDYDELRSIYRTAGNTGGDVIGKKGKRHSGALQRVRVALGEHGELGPVLVDADQKFRGPKQVAPLKVLDERTKLQAQLDSYDETYPRLLRRREAGENVDRAIAFQQRRMDELQHQLAALK